MTCLKKIIKIAVDKIKENKILLFVGEIKSDKNVMFDIFL